MVNPGRPFVLAAAASIAVLASDVARGLDAVEFRADGRSKTVAGKVLAKAENGGLLLLARDGQIWPIESRDVQAHRQDPQPFEVYPADQFAQQLSDEMGPGFEVYPTRHYLICHSTSLEYARWCERLFERLYRGFTAYWKARGFPIEEPLFPLVAIVFGDRDAYVEYGRREVGDGIQNIVGYYSLQTNRVVLYDPRPEKERAETDNRRITTRRRNQILAQATGPFNVATIVHEATHQLAFNCGFHQRFADNPLWLTEGMALYFETPDPGSDDGWSEMGKVNSARLEQFRRSVVRGRPATALRQLLTNDDRLRTAATALDSYAEAWALSYFLIRTKPQQYHDYVRKLNAKSPLVSDGPETRLADFQEAFGADLERIDQEFVRYVTERSLR